VVAAKVCEEFEPAFLHLDYGQRTEDRERAAFDALADHYSVKLRLLARVEPLGRIRGSSLTDRSLALSDARREDSAIPLTYVPFGTPPFPAPAASGGGVLAAGWFFSGAVEEDSWGFPVCREASVAAFNRLTEGGARPETRLRVVAPLLHMSKGEIV